MILFWVFQNMFLAIINDTYAEVKAELAEQKNEFELAEYFKRVSHVNYEAIFKDYEALCSNDFYAIDTLPIVS